MNPFEVRVINKLRTEYINLNHYKYFRFIDISSNNGLCKYCNVSETVQHYLIDCPGQTNIMALEMNGLDKNYNVLRNEFKRKLKKISIHFKNPRNFNVYNILFPHIWKRKLDKKDGNYNLKKKGQILRSINVLKLVVDFVQKTRRFRREQFGM